MGIKKLMGLNAWAATLVAQTTKHDGEKKRKLSTWAHTGGVICGSDETPLHELRDFVFADGTFFKEAVQTTVHHPDGRKVVFLYLVDRHDQPHPDSRWHMREVTP